MRNRLGRGLSIGLGLLVWSGVATACAASVSIGRPVQQAASSATTSTLEVSPPSSVDIPDQGGLGVDIPDQGGLGVDIGTACLLTADEVEAIGGQPVAEARSDAQVSTPGVWTCDYADNEGRVVLNISFARPTPDVIDLTRFYIAVSDPLPMLAPGSEAYWLKSITAMYAFGDHSLLRVQSMLHTFQPGDPTDETLNGDFVPTYVMTRLAYGRIPGP